MALFAGNLLPASFRGAPFAVLSDETGGGRRVAVHQYPGRDEPWAEDMGRAARTFRFRGFIVDNDIVFAGGPIQLQRALLLAALEKSGPGTLTHPTLGILNVSVARFSLGQDLGASTMSTVDIEFVESGKKSFPSLLSTGSGLLSAATLCKVALAVDLARGMGVLLSAPGAQTEVVVASSGCAGDVVAKGNDATALANLTSQLPGNFGRYSTGANAGYAASRASPYAADVTVDDLIVHAAAQRSLIARAAQTVQTAAADLGTAASLTVMSTSMIDLVDTLVAACADPADAARLLIALVGTPPIAATAGAAVILAFQRAVAAELGAVCAVYEPQSYDDAIALLQQASAVIDRVATAAADAGDDESAGAMDALLAEVVRNLRARGADLAPIKTFAFGAAMPDIVLAQRLYRDPSRADQLLAQCPDVINPLFMPINFQALAA